MTIKNSSILMALCILIDSCMFLTHSRRAFIRIFARRFLFDLERCGILLQNSRILTTLLRSIPLRMGYFDGVFRWGMNDGGDEFYWRTKGKPNQWDVVIFDRGSCVWKLIEGQSFSDVLYAMLTDTLEEFWLQNDTPEGEPRCVPFD